MARYAVATGNWADTAVWSESDGGAPGASIPTVSEDVLLTATSGAITVTVAATASCKSLNCTGFTGSLVGTAALTVGGTGNVGDFTLGAGMTYNRTGVTTFAANGSVSITTAGKAFGNNLTFNNSGGSWTFVDDFATSSACTITLTAGTLSLNGRTVVFESLVSSNSNTRTLDLTNADIRVTTNGNGYSFGTPTNMTLITTGSTLRSNGTGVNFNLGSLSYNNFVITGGGTGTGHSVTGANTFVNFTYTGTANAVNIVGFSNNQTITGTLTLTGSSGARRVTCVSSVFGTARTLTCAAVALTNVDFRDTIGAGDATWTGTRIGDCGGNSNITSTTPKTVYWVGTGAGFDTNRYALTSGGATATNNAPLPQDTLLIDANSGITAANTITLNCTSAPSMDFTGVPNTPTLTSNVAVNLYGYITLVSDMVIAGTNTWTHRKRGVNSTFTSAGHALGRSITVDAVSGTLSLADDMECAALLIQSGDFNAKGNTLTSTSYIDRTTTLAMAG